MRGGGGWLVTSSSTRDDVLLHDLATPTWLGGCDGDDEGTWRWFNGEAWAHQRWTTDQPDGGDAEDCLSAGGRWGDQSCTTTSAYGAGIWWVDDWMRREPGALEARGCRELNLEKQMSCEYHILDAAGWAPCEERC